MNNMPDPEKLDDDNPEWTQTMFDEAKTAAELFPHLFKEAPREDKVSATILYDADILSAFRATGKGWENRMNDALREWLREHAAS